MDESNEKPWKIPSAGFRSQKAAQICAFFAGQNRGPIDKLKLIKLIYLSEREFLSKHNTPMLFDEFYSLPRGPICSNALNGINGRLKDMTVWDKYILRNGNLVVNVEPINRDLLDHISDAEMEVLEGVWEQFSNMNASELSNYTHENCPEYTETGRRVRISYREILEALGEEDAIEIANDISNYMKFQGMLESSA